MKNRNTRLEVIKMILSSQEIASQEDLLVELDKAGFASTQATLSRDLKKLKVVKAAGSSGHYVYMLPANNLYRRVSETHLTVSAMNRLGALSVKFSGNLAVIHTLPGHAGHVAYDIDNSKIDEFIGTIAGDDTVMLVLAEGVDREAALQRLASVMPDLR
ncbi:MAG: arginine repressor [Paraprevotella sp.]|nr:arginine repressor [Paraprevotella sp.]